MRALFFSFFVSYIFAASTLSVEDLYSVVLESYRKSDWDGVVKSSNHIMTSYKNSPYLSDVYYFSGVAFFEKGEIEDADKCFSLFLDKYSTPKHFEEAVIYKFKIGELFANGARKHIMGWKHLPKWASGRDDALFLYDQVISMLPNHDVCARAMFNKAELLFQESNTTEAIDQYQDLIDRFGDHPLVVDSYLSIVKIYDYESENSSTDSYFLEMVEHNINKLSSWFPCEQGALVECNKILSRMEERYAEDLWSSVKYFDKKNKKEAAYMYYNEILKKYPQTECAKRHYPKAF